MIVKSYFLSVFLTVGVLSSCFSQKLVKKQSDAILLIEQKERFINKPLKVLLNDIKPAIKYAYGEDAKDHGRPAYFTFKFVTKQQNYSLVEKGIAPIVIYVYVKEKCIDWGEFKKLKKETFTSWTADDFRFYSNFTVIDIDVYGQATFDE
jgi:hypothetical protein